MSVQSNIGMYYEELVESLAERARLNHEEEPELDKRECIMRAIDEGMIYTVDQAYMLAHAVMSGYVEVSNEVDWDKVWAELEDDVYSELEDWED